MDPAAVCWSFSSSNLVHDDENDDDDDDEIKNKAANIKSYFWINWESESVYIV